MTQESRRGQAFQTRQESATFLAHLAVGEDLAWGDPETLIGYRISDFACGSGTLITAT